MGYEPEHRPSETPRERMISLLRRFYLRKIGGDFGLYVKALRIIFLSAQGAAATRITYVQETKATNQDPA
jgi:hypothetical protein